MNKIKNLFTEHKKIIIFLVIVVILITVLFVYLRVRQAKLEQLQSVTPTFTGAKDEPLPEDVFVPAQQSQNLRSISPVDKSEFSLDYDYKTFKFMVTIKAPIDTNLQIFQNWLKDNNFNKIPSDKFIIQNAGQ